MRLAGRFDYTTRNQFMTSMESFVEQAQVSEVRVDMGALDYIDSSALGMLLLMRDKARKFGGTVAITNAHGNVRQVLDTAQFERLFRVA